MRILVVGDSHGDLAFMEYAIWRASERGCTRLVQLGDFGWDWPGDHHHFATSVAEMATNASLPVFFLDGNHENHTSLDLFRPADAPVEVMDGLWYLPRGCAWEWGGKRFVALGGAYSIDQWARTEGLSWWPQETPSWDDVNRAIDRGPADIVFTHDAPFGIKIPGHHSERKDTHKPSRWTRKAVRSVVESARPERLFHGHHHVRYRERLRREDGGTTLVQGLGCNFNPSDAWTTLDL